MLEFVVNGQRLMSANDVSVVADTINYIEMRFEFDEDWSDVIPWAELVSPDGKKITPIIDTEVHGNHGLIPEKRGINLTEGVWTLSLIGDRYREGECVKRITTNTVTITVSASGITDGEPFVIDIDAGTEIIARAASFAEIAEGKVAEAEEKILQADKRIDYTQQMIREVEGISEKAAKDAKTAMDAADKVPAAVKNASAAAQTAASAAGNANSAATKASDLYLALKAAWESGSFNGKDGFSPTVSITKEGKTATIIITDKNGKHGFIIEDGKDGQGAEITAAAIAQALGYVPASKNVVDMHTNELVTQAEDIDGLERTTGELVSNVGEISESIANQGERIDELENNPNIVWCEYGKATYAEVESIVDNGGIPAVKAVNYYGYLTVFIYAYTTSEYHIFISTNGENTNYYVRLSNRDAWTSSISVTQLISYRVQEIKSTSASTQYPSAKAVYEYAEPKKGDWVLKGAIVGDENDRGNIDTGVYVDLSGCTELVVKGYAVGTGSSLLNHKPGNNAIINGIFVNGTRTFFAHAYDVFGGYKFDYAKYIGSRGNYISSTLSTYDFLDESVSSIKQFYVNTPSVVTECNVEIYAR